MITKESMAAIQKELHDLDLPEGQARICCLGCGKSVLVSMGHEHQDMVEMKAHALQHEPELSDESRTHAAARQDVPTNDLIVTVTRAYPREELLD